MNRVLYIASVIAMFAGPVFADTLTVYYPERHCAEILSQEYSTGGGETAWQILEILCRDSDGNYNGFVDSWASAAGFFGMGRLAIPDRFQYVPYDGDTLRVE